MRQVTYLDRIVGEFEHPKSFSRFWKVLNLIFLILGVFSGLIGITSDDIAAVDYSSFSAPFYLRVSIFKSGLAFIVVNCLALFPDELVVEESLEIVWPIFWVLIQTSCSCSS